MKKFKKLASMALALIMVAALPITAFAAPEDEEPAKDTNSMVCDELVGIGGLQDGDIVTYYQVLEWNNGWQTAEGFESMADSLYEIAHGATDEDGKMVPGGISADLAGELGKLASSVKSVTVITASGHEAVYNNPAPGLYMAIITAGTPGYFYNPVFVAADFNPDNTILSLGENELSYNPKAQAKVNRISVEKDAPKITADAWVGDPIDFTVTTMVPTYAGNYTNPVFKITDVLSDGLKFDPTSMVISGTWMHSGEAVEFAEGDYTYAFDAETNTYTIDFDGDYLKKITDQINLTVTYQAIITDVAASVNPEENTVTVRFSNSPDDETGAGRLRDRTNHYTFTIAGSLFGTTGYEASEIVKVGIDANGNEITDETVTLSNMGVIGALQGAEFKLYKSEEGAKAEDDSDLYINDSFKGTVTSGADGRMHMEGLDAGVYYLKETSAPAGYIKSQDIVKIEIVVTDDDITEIEVKDFDEDGTEVTYKMNILTGYNVFMTVGGGDRQQTANYEFTNEGPVLKEVTQGDLAGTSGDLGKVFNTVGVELPSTGGIGTTIFYIIGGCLVIGAGVLLVVKKRVGGKEEA